MMRIIVCASMFLVLCGCTPFFDVDSVHPPQVCEMLVWFEDVDEDGYGSQVVSMEACEQPVGFISLSDDCDDSDSTIHPGAEDVCDGIDQNCDGELEMPELADLEWFFDADEDTFGAGEAKMFCFPKEGFVPQEGDCEPLNPSAFPGADEIPENMIDDDCDGLVDETS